MRRYCLSGWWLCVLLFLRVSGDPQACPPSSCPVITDIDLSPLSGVWEAVYYTQAEGEENPDIPHFFNISLCAPITTPTSCEDSRVCYSEYLESFHNLGTNCHYDYDSGIKQIKFLFDYTPGLVFGNGNVSVTLVCGRTLGVPEVIEGDPNSHAIDILWVTSAACKNSSSLASSHEESKCYHVHPYSDNGLRAKFIDLTGLIRPEGYTVSYPERPSSRFILSVCRPLDSVEGCANSMACLNQTDPSFASTISPPLSLGEISGGSSSLHMEGDLLTVVYSVSVKSGACFDSESGRGNHSVKIHFLCPSGNEDLGPRVTFLDDSLCLVVVHWYTSYACGNGAIQSTGCTLTTSFGLTFDLTGLSSQESITSSTQLDVKGGQYRYDFKICSENSLSTGCAQRDQPIRVTQIDSGGVCRVLGVGAGRLRYVDGELTLLYGLGDPCHTNFARTTIINFICPENVESNSSVITFSGEEDCFYQFEWVTPLACGTQTSGVSSCQFESLGSIYNFAPLVGTEDENWVALDTDEYTQCFMVNPCGTLAVAPDPFSSPAEYCNARLAPVECAGTSVCQIKIDATFKRVGRFHLGESAQQVHSVDSSVVTVMSSEANTNLSAVVHYVCKVGDLTTPPIFIGITNEVLYEFHWMTYAACPTGIEQGSDCSVSHHSTGFLFNLTSLPPITFTKDGFQYNVSICKPLLSGQSLCPEAKTAVCQSRGSRHYSLGLANSTLVYEDGTLKLRYTGGGQCHHNGKPHRNTTLLFVCDSTAHAPVINDINEDYCDYVIEVRTKKACPPAYQAHSCLHFANGRTYDFSPLSRASGAGNWEARGRDNSLYYINICQPLNSVVGCNPLSAVCRVQSSGGHTSYTNTALASTANFTSVGSSGREFNLKYEYKNLGEKNCPVVTTTIHMRCNNQSSLSAGPKFVSGGDDANPCDYLFVWETLYACPVQPRTSHTCSVAAPSGYTFDLSSLSTLNSSVSYFSVDSSAGHTYLVSMCHALNRDCHTASGDNGTVAVCQIDSAHTARRCGLFNTRQLTYFDGSLKMTFTGGDMCHHNNKKRSVLINFECDRTLADYRGYPHFVSENEDCGYTFDWPTALACPPRELECVAGGGRYDLQPLLQQQVWNVRSTGNGYNYVIGGCRSLDFSKVPQCPQKPWMGACRYRDSDPPGSGTVLGYISSDIVEQGEGVLVLSYTNGDCRNGKRGVVHVHLQCGESVGEPTLVYDDSTDCVVRMDWSTRYACPRDQRVSDWFLEDPVTHTKFNLSALPASLSQQYKEADGSVYNYTVGLGGRGVACPRSWKEDTQTVGACQKTLTDIHNHTHPVHALGHVTANTTLQYVDGQISVEYWNGDECHHVSKHRKTVVSFACERSRVGFLEVFPEEECEYTFTVHTPLVCHDAVDIGVPCTLPHFASLDVFQGLGTMEVWLNATAVVYLSVCGTLDKSDSKLSQCPEGAAACLINNGAKVVHLGKPSVQAPPQPLDRDEGVLLKYTAGDECVKESRYSTRLLLICNRNIPVGAPEFVASTDCQFTFRWESINACPIHLPFTNTSQDVCSISDASSEFVYDFTNLVQSRSVITRDPSTDTTYIIQLCGTKSSLPHGATGCSPDTGICQKSSNHKLAHTVVKAAHKMVLTSHTPHTVEVVYTSGLPCDLTHHWTAIVSLQCASRGSSHPRPVLLSATDCRLDFVWQNTSFCVGEESCAVVDSNGHVYNFDGLFSQSWTGIVTSDSNHNIRKGATFTMSVCRNLNPFLSGGSHCSAPSGVCLHSPDGRHLNLGHMTGPPTIQRYAGPGDGSHPAIQAVYTSGDVCNTLTGVRYTTTLFLHCAPENSAPILSLHDDTSNCSWTVAMETPLACPPEVPSPNSSSAADSSECVMSTSEGEYDFTPLGAQLSFMSGDVTYSVCLCKSGSQCPSPSINATKSERVTRLGVLNKNSLALSSITGSPRLSFVNGDSCSSTGNSKLQTTIFMECNRSADSKKGELTLQTSLSDECHKYFFWSTPYACVSEEVSCTIAMDTGKILYDLSPLHSLSKPWEYTSGDKTYHINICGPIVDRKTNKLEGCGPQSSVCVTTPGSQGTSLATTSTQRIQVTNDGVTIRFGSETLPGGRCGSHVTVRMVCGIGGLGSTIDPSPNCYINDFTWRTPYACGENMAVTATSCASVDQSMFSDSYYSFQPSKLRLTTSYTTLVGGSLYYVNLCGPAPECGGDVSVCADSTVVGGKKTPIASYKTQSIMAEGYELLFQMTQGPSHAIVRVVCLLPEGSDKDHPLSGTLQLENVGKHREHVYYYFVLYTSEGCSFDLKTAAPPTTTHAVQAKPAASGHSTAVVLTLLAMIVVAVIVLAIIFYKKERRSSFKHFLEKVIIGKADEPVKYHKVPRDSQDEETALMGDSSDSDSSVTVDGEDVEGGAETVKVDVDIAPEGKDTNSDEELINL